ncbi:MAG: aspartate/glutamate racemase family protein [Burkholderiaceae bacterium]
MTPRIAFLHTSPVHIATFAGLAAAMAPEFAVTHAVDEALLADARERGTQDPALVRRIHQAMAHAAAGGAAAVVCTCSTIGGVAERTPTGGRYTAVRIDRAMADRAVTLGSEVLVVAALESTLGPTSRLVRESAEALGRAVEIRQFLVEGAWAAFLQDDRASYIAAIASAVRAGHGSSDVIVLAQASMAPAAQALDDLGIPVLASPALGVQAVVDRLRRAS